MDTRLLALLTRQQAAGFADLKGSEARASIRIAAPLLNEAVATFLAPVTAVRDVTVQPRAANRFDVRVTLAKPSFLPPLNLTLAIERQPALPADPLLILRMIGMGGMMRFAAPAIASFGSLPPGVRLDGDRILVDLRALLAGRGLAHLLDYAGQLEITTEEGSVLLLVQASIR